MNARTLYNGACLTYFPELTHSYVPIYLHLSAALTRDPCALHQGFPSLGLFLRSCFFLPTIPLFDSFSTQATQQSEPYIDLFVDAIWKHVLQGKGSRVWKLLTSNTTAVMSGLGCLLPQSRHSYEGQELEEIRREENAMASSGVDSKKGNAEPIDKAPARDFLSKTKAETSALIAAIKAAAAQIKPKSSPSTLLSGQSADGSSSTPPIHGREEQKKKKNEDGYVDTKRDTPRLERVLVHPAANQSSPDSWKTVTIYPRLLTPPPTFPPFTYRTTYKHGYLYLSRTAIRENLLITYTVPKVILIELGEAQTKRIDIVTKTKPIDDINIGARQTRAFQFRLRAAMPWEVYCSYLAHIRGLKELYKRIEELRTELNHQKCKLRKIRLEEWGRVPIKVETKPYGTRRVPDFDIEAIPVSVSRAINWDRVDTKPQDCAEHTIHHLVRKLKRHMVFEEGLKGLIRECEDRLSGTVLGHVKEVWPVKKGRGKRWVNGKRGWMGLTMDELGESDEDCSMVADAGDEDCDMGL